MALIISHLDGDPVPAQGERTVMIYVQEANPQTDGAQGYRVVATAAESGRRVGRWVSDCSLAAVQDCMLWLNASRWPDMKVAPGSPIDPNRVLAEVGGVIPLVPEGSDPNMNPRDTPRLFTHLLAMNFAESPVDPILPPALTGGQPQQPGRALPGPTAQAPRPAPQARPAPTPAPPATPAVNLDDNSLRKEAAVGVAGIFRALRAGVDMAEVQEGLADVLAAIELSQELDGDDLDGDFDEDEFDDGGEDELSQIEADAAPGEAVSDPESTGLLPADGGGHPPGTVTLDDGTVLLAMSLSRGYFMAPDGQIARALPGGRYQLLNEEQHAEAVAQIEGDKQESLRPLAEGEVPPGLSSEEAAIFLAMGNNRATEKMQRSTERARRAIERAETVRRTHARAEQEAAGGDRTDGGERGAGGEGGDPPATDSEGASRLHTLVPDDLMALKDAATHFQMSVSGLRKWARTGKITDYRGKLGGRQAKIFVSVADVTRFIESQNQAQASGPRRVGG